MFHKLPRENGGFYRKYKTPKELQVLLKFYALEALDKNELILSCGSGVTACAGMLGLVASGVDQLSMKIYDGSYEEWYTTAYNYEYNVEK
eukprot:Trichotokara_eunicae@DN3783_c0_g1_i4.p1